MLYQGVKVRVENIDPLAVGSAGPIHVTHDVSRESNLFDPSDPLIDVADNGEK